MHVCTRYTLTKHRSCVHPVLLQDVVTRNQQRDMLEAKRKEKEEAKAEREAVKEAKKKDGPKPRGRPRKQPSKKQRKDKKKSKAVVKRKVKEDKKVVKRSKKADPPSEEIEEKDSETKSNKDIPKEAAIYQEYVKRSGSAKRFNAAQAVKLGIELPIIPTFKHCKVIPYWSRGHGAVNVVDPETKKWKNVVYVGVPGVKDVEVLHMVSQLVSWQQFVFSSYLILSHLISSLSLRSSPLLYSPLLSSFFFSLPLSLSSLSLSPSLSLSLFLSLSLSLHLCLQECSMT